MRVTGLFSASFIATPSNVELTIVDRQNVFTEISEVLFINTCHIFLWKLSCHIFLWKLSLTCSCEHNYFLARVVFRNKRWCGMFFHGSS